MDREISFDVVLTVPVETCESHFVSGQFDKWIPRTYGVDSITMYTTLEGMVDIDDIEDMSTDEICDLLYDTEWSSDLTDWDFALELAEKCDEKIDYDASKEWDDDNAEGCDGNFLLLLPESWEDASVEANITRTFGGAIDNALASCADGIANDWLRWDDIWGCEYGYMSDTGYVYPGRPNAPEFFGQEQEYLEHAQS